MSHHKLKIAKQYIEAKERGDKSFEVRFNDRDFQEGDTITYTRDDPPFREYDGVYEITHVTGFAQKPDWVVFGDRLRPSCFGKTPTLTEQIENECASCVLNAECAFHEIFEERTTTTHRSGRVQIACKRGLWSVDAPSVEQARAEAVHYYCQYLSDGEYED